MQRLYMAIALWGVLLAPMVNAEAIIGYDGKEHHWHPHRDGLSEVVRHQREAHRHHGISHPRVREWDSRHMHHLLNQGPIVYRRNLRIATNTHHIRRIGKAGSLSAAIRNATENGNVSNTSNMSEYNISLNGIEENMLDSVYGEEDEDDDGEDHPVGPHRHLRSNSVRMLKKKSQQSEDEDSTAAEVEFQRRHRAHMTNSGMLSDDDDTMSYSPAAAPASSPASGPGPAPASGNSVYTMDEDEGAAEQGFEGENVEHDNMLTMTKDWRGEYGPSMHTDYFKICAEYPDNEWCRLHGYHKPMEKKSSAVRPMGGACLIYVLTASFRFMLA